MQCEQNPKHGSDSFPSPESGINRIDMAQYSSYPQDYLQIHKSGTIRDNKWEKSDNIYRDKTFEHIKQKDEHPCTESKYPDSIGGSCITTSEFADINLIEYFPDPD